MVNVDAEQAAPVTPSPMVRIKQEKVTPVKTEEDTQESLGNTYLTDQIKSVLMDFNSEMTMQMKVPKEKVYL